MKNNDLPGGNKIHLIRRKIMTLNADTRQIPKHIIFPKGVNVYRQKLQTLIIRAKEEDLDIYL